MKYFILLLVVSATAADEKSAQDFARSTTKFVPAFYKPISKTPTGNVIVSPFSAHLVLSLLESGSKGETAQQLRSSLFLPNDEDRIEDGAHSLLSDLKNSKVFDLANKIYVQKRFPVKSSFLETATEVYDAGAQNIDFVQPAAANIINKWVEKKTNNTIKNLVKDLSPQTVVLLVNALHLKANWLIPFDTRSTERENFYVTPKKVIQVEMMHLRGRTINYISSPSLRGKFIQLFLEGDTVMNIGLPDANENLREFEKNTLDVFASNPPFRQTLLNIALPKFKFAFEQDLENALRDIGVTKIFRRSEADLSGIAGRKRDLVVNKVVQKAFIDLNEGGVEAAAATAAGVVATSVVTEPKNFIVNRPFMFLIKVQDVVVFIGRVTEPIY